MSFWGRVQYWLHSGEGRSLFAKRGKQHTPAPLWGACGLQHQYDAPRSMLSFMQSSVSSLSLVLGLLPPVSSPPESDASTRTIFPLCTTLHFSGTVRFSHLSLDLPGVVEGPDVACSYSRGRC